MCTKSQNMGKITEIRALSGRFSPNAQISGHTQIYPGELGTLYKGSSMNWRGASLRVVWLRLFCVDDEEIRILIGLTPVCTWQASQLQEKAWQLHHQQNWVQSPAVLQLILIFFHLSFLSDSDINATGANWYQNMELLEV